MPMPYTLGMPCTAWPTLDLHAINCGFWPVGCQASSFSSKSWPNTWRRHTTVWSIAPLQTRPIKTVPKIFKNHTSNMQFGSKPSKVSYIDQQFYIKLIHNSSASTSFWNKDMQGRLLSWVLYQALSARTKPMPMSDNPIICSEALQTNIDEWWWMESMGSPWAVYGRFQFGTDLARRVIRKVGRVSCLPVPPLVHDFLGRGWNPFDSQPSRRFIWSLGISRDMNETSAKPVLGGSHENRTKLSLDKCLKRFATCQSGFKKSTNRYIELHCCSLTTIQSPSVGICVP